MQVIVKMPPRKTKESAASPKKEKATKTKAKKDPNAPKKPSGAYIFFCNDKRAEVKKANPEFGVADSGRELGSMWKSATDEDKKVGAVVLAQSLWSGCSIQATRSLGFVLSLNLCVPCRNTTHKQRRTRRGIQRSLQREFLSNTCQDLVEHLVLSTSGPAVKLLNCIFQSTDVAVCCRYTKKSESKKEDEDTKEEVDADED